MRNRFRGIAGVLVAGALSACVISAAPAAAAPAKIKVASKSTTITGPGVIGTVVASCPKGTQAVSGGYSQSPAGSFTGSSLIDISDSYRLSRRSWTVTGTQVSNGSGALSAYAYCQRGISRVTQVVKLLPIGAAARSEVTATAICPGNTKLLSGGYRKPGFASGSFVFLSDNERASVNSHTVTAVRASTPAATAGTVYSVAYCLSRAKVKNTLASADLIAAKAPSSGTAVTAPKCKGGKSTFAGGFRSPFVTGPNGDRAAFLPTDSFLVQKKWQVTGLAFAGDGAVGLPVKLTAIGYCR